MTVYDWLLDGDPAVRWQVMRDLLDAPEEEWSAERAKVATEGWGGRLLALRDDEGLWARGAYFPGTADLKPWERVREDPAEAEEPSADGDEDEEDEEQPWTATAHSLALLREFGLDPASPQAKETLALVRANARWEYDGLRFFNGEVEPCINGQTVAIGAYFGQDVEPIVERLLTDQLGDDGWNCWTWMGSTVSSFNSTIAVLEGLLTHEQSTGGSDATRAARRRGEEYLLERGLLRRLSTGEVVDRHWLEFSFPTRWYYDVLRGLEYFRASGEPPPSRAGEAVDLVRSKQQPDGRWLLENTHPGEVHFELEDGDGQPSRWNTLRALRVLQWYEGSTRIP